MSKYGYDNFCDFKVSSLRGLAGGEENGRHGYQMTFAIAYIRVSDGIIVTSLLYLYDFAGSSI